MKFPESWLREHVAISASREELAATLTAIGLEVEAIEPIGAELPGVVVAQIMRCERHPEADRLQLCQVDIGAQAHLQIVCGAPNARVGLKAPLATLGATLPGGHVIETAKLRGIESSGMLCSARELGVDADTSGLLELPSAAMVGARVDQVLGLPDARFELKLTPNRADCLSVRGLAFDVAAAMKATLSAFEPASVVVDTDARVSLLLNAGADCPRYCGRVVDGIDPSAVTPAWMGERLRRSGVRPLSFLVDVTQYVMLEMGQPMHAFDADTLHGTIEVRRARVGESLKLIDERDVELNDEFLIIADSNGPVALAGVMGGFDTRVRSSTTRVFLESAHFAPTAIIGRSRRLGLHTDAAHRFERGVDPSLPSLALERASALILSIAGGRAGPVVEAVRWHDLPASSTVSLRRDRLRRVLGLEIPAAEVSRILNALGMQVEAVANGWRVTPPSRRFDIAIEEDLIEEIARIHGYDRIPSAAPTGAIILAPVPEAELPLGAFRQQMAACDCFEAINFAFADGALLKTWQLDGGAVALANPLSAEMSTLRTSLLPGLIESLKHNRARQSQRVRLFECGRVFHADPGAPPRETLRIAAAVTGSAFAEQWSDQGAEKHLEVDFFDLKGHVESLIALSGVRQHAEFRRANEAWLHPGRSAEVWRKGICVGVMGHLHPRLLKRLDLNVEVVVFELELEPLRQRDLPQAVAISRFPSVRRDLAVVVTERTPWSALESCLRGNLGERLGDVILFDRYAGQGLEPGFKSLAMGLILQDSSRTLTDVDADSAVQLALLAMQRDCGAVLRR